MRLSEQTIPNEVLEDAPKVQMSRRSLITGLAAGTVVPIVTGCQTNPETGASRTLEVDPVEDPASQRQNKGWLLLAIGCGVSGLAICISSVFKPMT